jgi:anti-sigma factor (TIGR02949 family)
MNCQEFEAHLHPYVDGELGVEAAARASAHAAACLGCRNLADGERRFRQLLRHQPRESAPPELRARILGLCRRAGRRPARRMWVAVPALAAAAALVLALVLPRWGEAPSLVGDLVGKHIAYAQLERPAEFASTSGLEIEQWFKQHAGLRVTVPDYAPAGIRLVGARIAEANQQKAAYVLYEKGHVLLSIFMVPASERAASVTGTRVAYRGSHYVTAEVRGYRTVSWTDGQVVFSLVSALDYDGLLECADRLRVERQQRRA